MTCNGDFRIGGSYCYSTLPNTFTKFFVWFMLLCMKGGSCACTPFTSTLRSGYRPAYDLLSFCFLDLALLCLLLPRKKEGTITPRRWVWFGVWSLEMCVVLNELKVYLKPEEVRQGHKGH